MLKLLNSIFVLIILPFALNAQLWKPTEMASMPESVSNNAVCEGFIGDAPYVFSFSGIDSTKIWSGIHLKSWRYDVNLDQWESIAPLPDPNGGKIAASANRIGDIIYIIGGYHVAQNGSETSSSKVHRYQVSTNSYLEDGMDIPVAIDDQVQAVWRDSLIYVVTGWSDNTNVPNVQIYNPVQDNWFSGTPVPNNNFYKAFGAAGAIIGDTIYYQGGAALGSSFPGQYRLRKGVINPENPAEITWSVSSVFGITNIGYRMAAFEHQGYIHWLGGSGVTYNFNGIAYNGSGGVEPANRNLYLNTANSEWNSNLDYQYPMDLRGIADVSPETKYLAGGMLDGQSVTNKTFKLEWELEIVTSVGDFEISPDISIYPNPSNGLISFNLRETVNSEILVNVSDLSGKNILNFDLQPTENTLNLSMLNPGTYLLVLRIENENFSKLIRIDK